MQRQSTLHSLFENQFDLLIIGGGATGAGIAVDAALRGYKTALIEAEDFSSGSSSRSTKLLHGGVRYLEQAFLHFDYRQLLLVRDSLKERAVLMRIAPYLTNKISIILPAYKASQKYYYAIGLKVYEWLAGRHSLGPSHSLSAAEVKASLPGLSPINLKGGVSYLDGQFDDARFTIALIQTAVAHGCVACNYVGFKSFTYAEGKIKGVLAKDARGGGAAEIRARVVVNATGCFADVIRQVDKVDAPPLLAPSRGTHIVLKRDKLPLQAGFLVPGAAASQVVFGLPWQGEVLIGTTDILCKAHFDPQPTEEEIAYLLDRVQTYFSASLSRRDVVAAWAGIRPLYKGNEGSATPALLRDHYIECSSTGLYSIVGGKWTTYRLMAKDLLDRVVAEGALEKRGACATDQTLLSGANADFLQLEAELSGQGIPRDIAFHLVRTYGGNAIKVLPYAKQGFAKRLHSDFPYIEAEVVYLFYNEFVCSAKDALYRRLRLGFFDQKLAEAIEQRVDEIIALC